MNAPLINCPQRGKILACAHPPDLVYCRAEVRYWRKRLCGDTAGAILKSFWDGDTRCVVTLTFDIDGPSATLRRNPELAANPSTISMGEFGPRVGLPIGSAQAWANQDDRGVG